MIPLTPDSRIALLLLGALTTAAWAGGGRSTDLPYGSGYESRLLITQPASEQQPVPATLPTSADAPRNTPAAGASPSPSGSTNAGRGGGASGGGHRGGRGR